MADSKASITSQLEKLKHLQNAISALQNLSAAFNQSKRDDMAHSSPADEAPTSRPPDEQPVRNIEHSIGQFREAFGHLHGPEKYNAFREALEHVRARRAYLHTLMTFLLTGEKSQVQDYMRRVLGPLRYKDSTFEKERKELIDSLRTEIQEKDTYLHAYESEPFSQKLLDEFFDSQYILYLQEQEVLKFVNQMVNTALKKSDKTKFHATRGTEEFRELYRSDFYNKACIRLVEPHISRMQREFRSHTAIIQWKADAEVLMKRKPVTAYFLLPEKESLQKAVAPFYSIKSIGTQIETEFQEKRIVLSKYPELFPEKLVAQIKEDMGTVDQVLSNVNANIAKDGIREVYRKLYTATTTILAIGRSLRKAIKIAEEREQLEHQAQERQLDSTATALVTDAISEARNTLVAEYRAAQEKERIREEERTQMIEQQKARDQALAEEQKRNRELFRQQEERRKAVHQSQTEHLRALRELEQAQRRTEVVTDHKATREATELQNTASAIKEEDIFKLLFALNPSNFALLLRFYEKPTPHCQIPYDQIVVFFGDPTQGKFSGSLTPAGRHQKLVIQRVIGFYDLEGEEAVTETAEAGDRKSTKPAGNRKKKGKASKDKSVAATGGTFRPHGGQKSGQAPSIVIEQVRSTLERAGVTKERLKLFCDAMTEFQARGLNKENFSDFLKIVNELRESLKPTPAPTAIASASGFTPLLSAQRQAVEPLSRSDSTVAPLTQITPVPRPMPSSNGKS